MKNVLVEGGGELMAAFLEAKLLNEIYVTLTPWVLGGKNNPTLVGGPGLSEWSALKLLKQKKLKDEIYLHYKVLGAKILK
jgi:riboflavin biosynthesis pyrimidine reductase